MKRIYIPVLLILLLTALHELAWAASPSYAASVTCDDRSHDLAYPIVDFDADTTSSCNPDQTALESELSGRFGQVRSYGAFAHAWTDLADCEATVNSTPTPLELELSGRFGQVRSYGTFARAWAEYSASTLRQQ